jgi:hypothetical protein
MELRYSRLTLAAFVRKLGRQPTIPQKLDLAQRRERLQTRIDTFHWQAAQFWAPDDMDSHLQGPTIFEDPDVEFSDSDDDDDEERDNVFVTETKDPGVAEQLPLLLPSNLGLEVCQQHGYAGFVSKEKTLSVGQANDALQGLRLSLSHKAVIFREGVRIARTKTRKTRAWDQVLMVDVNVQHHARLYRRSREALICLGATEADLQRYQILQKEHLSVTSARIDPSLRGQRDSSLPWFWTMDIKKDTDTANGMAECEYCEFNESTPLIFNCIQFIECIG